MMMKGETEGSSTEMVKIMDDRLATSPTRRKRNNKENERHHTKQKHHGGGGGKGGHEHHDDHGHSGGGTFALLFSGLISGILMFVFACVFASMVFEACAETADYVPIGVSVHTITIALTGGLTATFASLPINIAGIDVNPALFLALMSKTITTEIAGTCTSSHGAHAAHAAHAAITNVTNSTGRRFLAAAAAASTNATTSATVAEEAAATILAAVSMSTLVIAIVFFILGYWRLTRIVQFVPSCVLSGFLAVVGFKIMLKAVDAATGEHISFEMGHMEVEPIVTGDFWAKLSPAIPLGVSVYYLKKHHIGNPMVMLPLLLGVPLIAFYIILVAKNPSGGSFDDDLQNARSDGWYYPEFEKKPFYAGFQTLYGTNSEQDVGFLGNVQWDIIPKTLPDLAIMVLIVVIDALLKLAGTRKKLEFFDLDFNKEMELQGMNNFLNFWALGAPGYSQLKFNLLNAGIAGTMDSRVPGYICAGINLVLYLSGFMAINYMPRFWLGALVIYAGLGFLDDNLVGTFGHMTWQEYGAVWIVLLIGVLESLHIAIAIGFIFALAIFVVDYSGRGVIHSRKRGYQHKSSVVRPSRERQRLMHLGKLWCVVELKRFLFFASVYEVQDLVADIIKRIEKNSDDENVHANDVRDRRPEVYQVGDTVEIDPNESDAWFAGTVTAVHGNGVAYDVARKSIVDETQTQQTRQPMTPSTYNDVPAALVRSGYAFKIGDEIKARLKGGPDFYDGRVTKVHFDEETREYSYDILYEDGVPRKDMSLITAPPGVFRNHRYIVLDFSHVDGVDFTGASVFLEIAKMCKKSNVNLVFSGIQDNSQTYQQLNGEKVFDFVSSTHETVGMAVESVEDELLVAAAEVRRHWLLFEPFKKLHFTHVQKTSYRAFEEAFGGDLGSHLSTFTDQIRLSTGDVLIDAGETCQDLFLVQSGRLGAWIFPDCHDSKHVDSKSDAVFSKTINVVSHGTDEIRDPGASKSPDPRRTSSSSSSSTPSSRRSRRLGHLESKDDRRRIRVRTYTRGAFVNDHVLAGQVFSPHVLIADHDSVVLRITPKHLSIMERKQPKTFTRMLRSVLYSESLIRHTLEAEEELERFNTVVHKRQIEYIRKKQDIKHFRRQFRTPFTVLKKHLTTVIERKVAERERKLREKHKADALRVQSMGSGMNPTRSDLSGVLLTLRNFRSTNRDDPNVFKVGDHVRITKVGSQTGNTAVVKDPNWNTRVKVVMDVTGAIKSYKPHEIEKVRPTLPLAQIKEGEFYNGQRVVVVKTGSSQMGNTAVVVDPKWSGRIKVQMEKTGVVKSYLADQIKPIKVSSDMSKIENGDRVKIVKKGSSKNGKTAIVSDPSWSGRVKVEMEETGAEKSYLATELVVIKKNVGFSRRAIHVSVKFQLPKHIQEAAHQCFVKQVEHELETMVHLRRCTSHEGPVLPPSKSSLKSIHASSSPSGGGIEVSSPSKFDSTRLPLNAIRDSIVAMGIYPQRHQMESAVRCVVDIDGRKADQGVTYEEFVEILKELVLESYTTKEIKQYRKLFEAIAFGKAIEKEHMVKLLVMSDHDDDGDTHSSEEHNEASGIVENLFDAWASVKERSKKGGVKNARESFLGMSFDEFMSMMAYHQKVERLMSEVEDAYEKFVSPELAYVNSKEVRNAFSSSSPTSAAAATTAKKPTDGESKVGQRIKIMHRTASDWARTQCRTKSALKLSASRSRSRSPTHERTDNAARVRAASASSAKDTESGAGDETEKDGAFKVKRKQSFAKVAKSIRNTFKVARRTSDKRGTITALRTESEIKRYNDRRDELARIREAKELNVDLEVIYQRGSSAFGDDDEGGASKSSEKRPRLSTRGVRAQMKPKLQLDNIIETLWLFGPTMSDHALKWSITDGEWSEKWIDITGAHLTWHDYSFAHSTNSIEIDPLLTDVLTLEDALKSNLRFEQPKHIPEHFQKRYHESNALVLHERPSPGNPQERFMIIIFEDKTFDKWFSVIKAAKSGKGTAEKEIRDVDQIVERAQDMVWEADDNGDGDVSFIELLLTIALVHENETDSVLKGEETKLLQEKITYLDPWLQANSVHGESVSAPRTPPRPGVSKSNFEAPSLMETNLPDSSPKASRHRRRSMAMEAAKEGESSSATPPPGIIPPPATTANSPIVPKTPAVKSSDTGGK